MGILNIFKKSSASSVKEDPREDFFAKIIKGVSENAKNRFGKNVILDEAFKDTIRETLEAVCPTDISSLGTKDLMSSFSKQLVEGLSEALFSEKATRSAFAVKPRAALDEGKLLGFVSFSNQTTVFLGLKTKQEAFLDTVEHHVEHNLKQKFGPKHLIGAEDKKVIRGTLASVFTGEKLSNFLPETVEHFVNRSVLCVTKCLEKGPKGSTELAVSTQELQRANQYLGKKVSDVITPTDRAQTAIEQQRAVARNTEIQK